MKKRNKVFSSAIFRLIVIVMAVVIPLNLLTLILGNTVITEVERQISLETQNVLELYVNQVDDAMERMNVKMYTLAREDEEFVRLNVKPIDTKEEYYRQMESVVKLNIALSDALKDNNLVDGVFAYFPEKDYFLEQAGTSQITKQVRNYVKAQVRTSAPEKSQNWQVAEIEGIPCLILISVYRQAYFGAWIDLRTLADTFGFQKEGNGVLQTFAGADGTIYHSNRNDAVSIDLNATTQKFNGVSYALVKAKSQCADLYYAQVMSKSQIASSLPAAIRVLQILSVVAVLIVPIILVAMHYWIGRPVGKLMDAMERIEQGDVEYRIEKTRAGTEFDRINRNFNRVMDEVSELKIHMYEQRLKAEKIRLGFLSQQIQPHFIINTLNILYSYEPEEYQLIQKMILCLSKYFRYVVNAPQDYVELGQEMEHIRNYFEIQQARFLRSFRAAVVYDPEVADCLVPPLLIQNFTENAIKHSFIPGQVTSIVAEARKEGEDRIHICVYDTGAGIPEDVLERIAEFRRTREFRMDLGVGIQNSIDRLEILYGADASLDISRIEPQGTRIDIIIPIKRKERTADECDFG